MVRCHGKVSWYWGGYWGGKVSVMVLGWSGVMVLGW